MSLVIHLVVSLLFDQLWAGILAGSVALWFVGWWFVMPKIGRMKQDEVGKIVIASPSAF